MDMASPHHLLLRSLSIIPTHHYLLIVVAAIAIFLYRLFEIHFISDLLHGFRGDLATLTYHPSSRIYQLVASRCVVLHRRFLSTPWLASPHLQILFLNFFGWSPDVKYKRHLYQCADGGTIALDWLFSSDVKDTGSSACCGSDAKNSIVLIIPGLTSDSNSAYVKHFVFKTAREGCDVVVVNHRGLGGVSITSDCFYNAGWTEDVRKVIEHVNHQHPDSYLFAVGTSIGANILVKYLGESGPHTPLVGAAAICGPWDLVICDRFIHRRFAQRIYDKAIGIGLLGYAKLHHSVISRLADWNAISKSHSIRDFDDHATRVLANFETVDTYYRRSSCVEFIGKVSIPLLCIAALDDPICSREAIPWDECRANPNIVLAATRRGGHLAFYEGLTANSMWWVRCTAEFVRALLLSSLACTILSEKKEAKGSDPPPAPQNGGGGGIEAAPGDESAAKAEIARENDEIGRSWTEEEAGDDRSGGAICRRLSKRVDALCRRSRASVWLLAYVAVAASWPFLGSALRIFFRRKLAGKN